MSRNVKILIVIVAAVLIGLGFYLINNYNRSFVTDSWKESYSPSDKGPYGTFVFKELLDTNGIFSNFIELNGKLEDKLEDNLEENDIYFFIGKQYYLSNDDFESLKSFVENGNTALISSEDLPNNLKDFFFVKLNATFEKQTDTAQTLKFNHPRFSNENYKFNYINNNLVKNYSWVYFQPNNFQYIDQETIILGQDETEKINFIEIPFGEGSFYLHTTPYSFTNISMFQNQGFEYAEDLIHHLEYGLIQWDTYNLRYHYDRSNGEEDGGNGNNDSNKRSIFEFIFKHTSLTWAFGILLFTAILYAFFKGKRRQKVIGAIELKENSSLRYIETVSSLYLQERKHNKLIHLQKITFIDFIANRYFIVSHKIDEKYVERLNNKSGIESDLIKSIFISFETLINNEFVSDNELIELQQKIEYFYKKCN